MSVLFLRKPDKALILLLWCGCINIVTIHETSGQERPLMPADSRLPTIPVLIRPPGPPVPVLLPVPIAVLHPLDPLSGPELFRASQIIKNHFRQTPIVFSTVTLKEPLKSDLLPFFLQNIPPPSTIPRKALAVVIDPITETTFEIIVNLRRQVIESLVTVAHGLEPMFSKDESDDISGMVLEDFGVQRRLFDLGISNLSLVVPSFWNFGYAGDRPEYLGKRICQVFFSSKMFQTDNNYAHPMGFVAIVDILKKRVLDIEDLPIHGGFDTRNRQGDGVAKQVHNYDPTLLPASFFRKDVSPLQTSQPAGPGYRVTGNQIEWQNYKLRIGFNDREGLVLHTINYNDKGNVRPLIYRASISELFVPYGDARPPFHRKMAYDAGQYGLGGSAHQLNYPSDCRGSVTFFHVVVNNKAGLPVTIKQAVCVYEEDAGSLLKKFNSNTQRSFSVRSQRLVITFTATSGNYDYQFNWMFYQDASIKMELQLHGIDNPSFIAPGHSSNGHGTILAPEINAQYHQHFFTARLDAEFDGNKNTVVTVDAVSDGPTGSPRNPYGNGFGSVETVLKTASQGRSNANPQTSRTWTILGDLMKRHPYSKKPMGYRLIAENPANLLMNSDSPLHPKCAFVDHTVWVTQYQEDQLYPGGFYLNNSGLPEWVGRNPNANVENTDLVLWHVFGMTHIPRAEDFPVMPTESVGFWLRPTNFFLENPALDVPSFVDIPPAPTRTNDGSGSES